MEIIIIVFSFEKNSSNAVGIPPNNTEGLPAQRKPSYLNWYN
jgi:hypothetical protein